MRVYSCPMHLGPLDFLCLLFLPIMVGTALDLKKRWHEVFDQTLTSSDRYLLQRLVIFWLLPAVVFCHELGHVFAIKLFGGQVKEFHYAFIWGYVVPDGNFSPEQIVWMYLAGSLVQIIIGLAALMLSALVSSPPAVALLVYLGLWSVGGTVVIYALMSITGAYGDWVAIYLSPAKELVRYIAVVHGLLVAFIFWCLYGAAPRKWFVSRTTPQWTAEQTRLWQAVQLSPCANAWLNLGKSFYRVGLLGQAENCLKNAKALDPQFKELLILEGAIASTKGNLKQASANFLQLVQAGDAPSTLRLKALLALADCQIKSGQAGPALTSYSQAQSLDPSVADPGYWKAVLLKEQGRNEEALTELLSCINLEWLDPGLKELASNELQDFKSNQGLAK